VSVVAIIPFRSLDHGKTRLAIALAPELRRQLCRGMLQRTVRLVAGVAQVLVVSDDPRVAGIVSAACSDAAFLQASQPGDLNGALNEAREAAHRDRSIVVVPTDLPLLDRSTLRRFIADDDTVGIAADRSLQGTNLLLLPRPARADFRFAFGPGSFKQHVAESRRLGLEPRVSRSMRTAFDLDTPADLAEAKLLRASIAGRLYSPAHF
jgi:2-phospho-L-lactate/phosphoenolpyruvate guanylyltransferase